ncbi:MAG: hypothetical protein ACKPKO_49725, partial [Candidatus Fonsibacter sp.]
PKGSTTVSTYIGNKCLKNLISFCFEPILVIILIHLTILYYTQILYFKLNIKIIPKHMNNIIKHIIDITINCLSIILYIVYIYMTEKNNNCNGTKQ